MLIITGVGVCALLLIQFILYKKQGNGTPKTFVKSNQLLEILKEFLIILLSTTLALNFTNIEQKKQTNETVVKLLDVTQNDISSEYAHNVFFITEYNNESRDAQTVKVNVKHNSALIESVLDNSIVMTTISPLMYSVLSSEVRNLNSFYDSLTNAEGDENIITMVLAMNSHSENILWALDAEIKHLQGIYSEKDLETLYQDYFESKYTLIEPQ